MAYSKTEKYLAQVLAKFPGLKSAVKRFYTIANFYLNRKDYNYKSEHQVKPVISNEKNESFFGYYDKSPVNSSGKYIIFHETFGTQTIKSPNPEKPIKIMLYDIAKENYNTIAETNSYNWQQGSKLQWLNESKLIFNDFDGVKFVSKIYDLNKNTFQNIDLPIYDCYKDDFALSLDFSRLNSTDKDYGYKNIAFNSIQNTLENDGIFFIDLKSNTSRLVISLKKVINLHFRENMKEAKHSFNHIMINHDGRSFIFIHRWYQAGKRYDSLILSNIEGTDVKVLADQDFVSHCCWYDPETVIGYFRHNSYGNSYYRIDVKTGQTEILSNKLRLFGDGHPSFFGNKMLFDSYPDRSRMQHLYIFDIEENEVNEIGSFLSPLKFFGETRCDLHPRWSANGKIIFFDSTHDGKRKLYRIELI